MCGDHLANGISSDSSIYRGDELRESDDYRKQMMDDLDKSSAQGRHETWLDYHGCRLYGTSKELDYFFVKHFQFNLKISIQKLVFICCQF